MVLGAMWVTASTTLEADGGTTICIANRSTRSDIYLKKYVSQKIKNYTSAEESILLRLPHATTQYFCLLMDTRKHTREHTLRKNIKVLPKTLSSLVMLHFFSCPHGLPSHYGLQCIYTCANTWLHTATTAATHATHK
jgi:hypothetical protein